MLFYIIKFMNKKVSVIIPTLNEENNIENCLSSLEKQDCNENLEIIVVDGQSTDKTKEITSKYNARVIDSPKRNIGFQKNLGTKACTGEFCFYLDADSIAPKNWISRFLEEYEKDRRTVMVGSLCSFDESFYSAVYQPLKLGRSVLSKFSLPLISGSSTSILKDVFYKVGGYTEEACEDAYLCLEAKKFGKIKLLNDIDVLTSSRGWKRKYAMFRNFVCHPVYAVSQGKINLRKITKIN